MKTPRSRLAAIIAKATLKNGVSSEYAREIAAYLLSERRTKEIDSLLRDVQAHWAEVGLVEAHTFSAHQLDSDAKQDIVTKVKQLYPSAKKVNITQTIDERVIGGVRVQLPHQQLDISLGTKLNRLKQHMMAGKA